MTCFDWKLYENEVIDPVIQAFDATRDKSLPDYVLLLGRGGYQAENEGTCLSPSCTLKGNIDEAMFRFITKEMKESDRLSYMFGKARRTCYYKDAVIYVAYTAD